MRGCQERNLSQVERPSPRTLEIDNRYYRKSTSCVPFQLTAGMPYVGVVVTSPDSEDAAEHSAYMRSPVGDVGDARRWLLDDQVPAPHTGTIHAAIRLFVSVDGLLNATCSDNCAFRTRSNTPSVARGMRSRVGEVAQGW